MKKLWVLIGLLLIASIAYGATIQRGYIGRDDLRHWTGDAAKYFTRTTSSGGSQAILRFGSVVDVIITHGGGTAYTLATLQDAINESTTTRGLLINPGTWAVTDDLTIPSYITLIMPPGAVMSVTVAKTLTIEGHIDAGEYQIFSGAGTTTITGVQLEHDKWKDDTGNDIYPTTDNSIDLGGSSNEFKDGYFDGVVRIDEIQMDGGELKLDADDDTSIQAGTDDEIDFKAANTIQLKITDGTIEPETDSDVDIGSSSKYFKTAYIDDVVVSGNFRLSPQMGYLVRAQFLHSTDENILIEPATYHHSGTTDQMVYWNTQLTFTTSGIAGGAADQIVYVYLDDSAIVTLGVPLLDNTCFVNSATAPTWTDAKRGWYGTGGTANDRCIFACSADATNDLLPWYHDGGRQVTFDTQVTSLSSTDVDQTFVEVTMDSPNFGDYTRVLATIKSEHATGDGGFIYWRKEGSSAATNVCGSTSDYGSANTFALFVNEDLKIEVAMELASDSEMLVYTDGFFLPRGM